MIAAASAPARRDAKPPTELSVYDGGRLMGTIKPKAGAFVARLANGRGLGEFLTDRLAMKEICAADRRARLEAQADHPSTPSTAATDPAPAAKERRRQATPARASAARPRPAARPRVA